jgi:imidazoleglycerol phosphate dehydratase HisB
LSKSSQVNLRSSGLDCVAQVAGLLILDAHRFVEDCQCAINEWNCVTAQQDEPVAKTFFGVADIPAHDAAQKRGDQHVDFGARPTRVATLAIVEDDVNELINQVFGLFPVTKVRDHLAVAEGDPFFGCSIHLSHSSFDANPGNNKRTRAPLTRILCWLA